MPGRAIFWVVAALAFVGMVWWAVQNWKKVAEPQPVIARARGAHPYYERERSDDEPLLGVVFPNEHPKEWF